MSEKPPHAAVRPLGEQWPDGGQPARCGHVPTTTKRMPRREMATAQGGRQDSDGTMPPARPLSRLSRHKQCQTAGRMAGLHPNEMRKNASPMSERQSSTPHQSLARIAQPPRPKCPPGHFPFESRCVACPAPCRFAEKTHFFRSLWAGWRCATLAFSPFTMAKRSAKLNTQPHRPCARTCWQRTIPHNTQSPPVLREVFCFAPGRSIGAGIKKGDARRHPPA